MTVSAVWTIADIFNGLMALPNMIALFALNGVVVYETKKFLRLVSIRNENLFDPTRRDRLESCEPISGREDIELNEAGIAQAVRCGQTLQGLGIEAVYTSPLKRAHCTGEEIAAQIGLSRDGVEPMQELIERDLGEFSGQLVKDKKSILHLRQATMSKEWSRLPMCRNAWSVR